MRDVWDGRKIEICGERVIFGCHCDFGRDKR